MPNRRDPDAAGRGPLPDVGRLSVPASLADLGWELPHTFLGLDEDSADFGRARAVVLPVPYEATTSWGGGTVRGPAAILEASRFIELYDQELDSEPYDVGIATLPALELGHGGPAQAMAALRVAYDRVLDAAEGKFVVLLGGEHALTGPPVQAWAERLRGERISVLQLDAHTDLRPEYEGSPHSHASVMYQIHDRADIVAVGIRALTREERALARRTDSIHLFLADDIHDTDDWIGDVVERLTDDVYITFDVDCFDPALVPSTGTPEPGGLQWYPVLRLLRAVFQEKNVVAADIVEHAPIPGLTAPDFLVAKLLYKMVGYRFD